MRIKKKNVLKESYLINEAILLDQLSHIKPNVKKVLKLMYKKFVKKDEDEEYFKWWRLSHYDIQEFLASLGEMDYSDTILLVNREATEAERIAINSDNKNGKKETRAQDYADNLKELLFYLRFSVKPKKLDKQFGRLSETCLKDFK